MALDKIGKREEFEIKGKVQAAEYKKKRNYHVEHVGRDKYRVMRRLRKRDIIDFSVVNLSLTVLLSGDAPLAEAWIGKLTATESAMSYLLYRFFLALLKRRTRCYVCSTTIKKLINKGARFTVPVVKSRSILEWSVLSSHWDTVRCVLQNMTDMESLNGDSDLRLSTGFSVELGIEYSPYESLYEFAIDRAPDDITVTIFNKGYEITDASESLLMSRSGVTRGYLRTHYLKQLEIARRELADAPDNLFAEALIKKFEQKILALEKFE